MKTGKYINGIYVRFKKGGKASKVSKKAKKVTKHQNAPRGQLKGATHKVDPTVTGPDTNYVMTNPSGGGYSIGSARTAESALAGAGSIEEFPDNGGGQTVSDNDAGYDYYKGTDGQLYTRRLGTKDWTNVSELASKDSRVYQDAHDAIAALFNSSGSNSGSTDAGNNDGPIDTGIGLQTDSLPMMEGLRMKTNELPAMNYGDKQGMTYEGLERIARAAGVPMSADENALLYGGGTQDREAVVEGLNRRAIDTSGYGGNQQIEGFIMGEGKGSRMSRENVERLEAALANGQITEEEFFALTGDRGIRMAGRKLRRDDDSLTRQGARNQAAINFLKEQGVSGITGQMQGGYLESNSPILNNNTYLHKKGGKMRPKYQEGGAPPPQEAVQQQDPMAMLIDGASQAVQAQDGNLALQVCQMLVEMTAGVGQEASAEGQPVMAKGGRLYMKKGGKAYAKGKASKKKKKTELGKGGAPKIKYKLGNNDRPSYME